MKIIECLSGKIEDELQDAEAYIEDAMKWKAEVPDTAATPLFSGESSVTSSSPK